RMTKTISHILYPISRTASRLLPSASMRKIAAIGLSATLLATANIPVLPIVLPSSEVEAAWYNEDWRYRAPVDITSPTTQPNVYMELTLDTSDSSRFNDDCSDLRFVSASGQLIPHHIASGCGTGSTQIQILFGELPAGESR